MIGDEKQALEYVQELPECDDAALERLDILCALLKQENSLQNLVSAASLAEIWRRHIADSAQLLRHIPSQQSGPWLDLGTGAGFPGLVIAALRPDCEMLMVESRAKRIDWLERAKAAMGLDRAQILGSRLELVESQKMAVISARAFAPLDSLLKLSARFSTEATCWLLPKGRSAQQELDGLQGWHHLFHVEQSLTDGDAGVIIGQLLGKKGRKA